LSDFTNELGDEIVLNQKVIKVASLVCLMSEDANVGAWCWLTSEKTTNGEWPLAYYLNKELH
jgi:hypothetical protein